MERERFTFRRVLRIKKSRVLPLSEPWRLSCVEGFGQGSQQWHETRTCMATTFPTWEAALAFGRIHAHNDHGVAL